MEFNVPSNLIQAALIFAGKNDKRACLNGVHFERGQMIATDGSMIGVFKLNQDVPVVTIPRHLLEHVKGDALTTIIIDGNRVDVTCRGITAAGALITEHYPDCRQALPVGEVANPELGGDLQFDHARLALLDKVANLVNGGKKLKAFIVRDPVRKLGIIDIKNEIFTGVLMPWRMEAVGKLVTEAPAWAFN